jgi:hypothetical protein
MTRLVAALSGVLVLSVGTGAFALPTLTEPPPAPTSPPAPPRAPKPTMGPVTPSATTPIERAAGEAAAPAPGGEKYVGVDPGQGSKNPLPPAKKAPPHLIWSGFKSGAGGSQVFFQTNLPVTFEVVPSRSGDAKELSVFLKNCRIHLRNNGRNLDTRFFATPVQSVSARQRHKDVELRIALKEPATPTPRTEPGPDGTQFLVLDFPPGQPAAIETSTPVK